VRTKKVRTKKVRHTRNKEKWRGMRTNENGLKGMRKTSERTSDTVKEGEGMRKGKE
jgi:hypothetical protein